MILGLGVISPVLADGIELTPDRVDVIDDFSDPGYSYTSYYLNRNILLDGNWAVLRHESPDGSVLRGINRNSGPGWVRRSHQFGTYGLHASCAAGLLCIANRTETLAIEPATGQTRRQLPPAVLFKPMADGSLLLLQAHVTGGMTAWTFYRHERLIIAADGETTLHRIEAEPEGSTTPIAIAADGTVYSADSIWYSLVVTDPSGDYRPLLTPGPEHRTADPIRSGGNVVIPSAVADDEGVFVLGQSCAGEHHEDCSSVALRRVDDSGLRWQLPVPLSELPGYSSRMPYWEMQPEADGGVVLAISHSDNPQSSIAENNFLLIKVSADGERLWQRHWRHHGLGGSRVFQIPDQQAIALVRPSPHRPALAITVVDAHSGRLRSESWIACPELDCDRWFFDVSPSGTLVALGSSNTDARVLWLDQIAAPAEPGIELDQVGLDGAWYSPRTDGQGFNLRLLPGSEAPTLFMPWFTHGHNQPDQVDTNGQLRWFTLQQVVPAGARALTLPIQRMDNGRFLDPDSGNLDVVGTAYLRFPDCRTGLLDYHFDEVDDPARDGIIVLHRLLPLTSDCIEADGSAASTTAAVDPMISGTWYDPAVPGQGLDIHHAVMNEGSGRVLFGTWHTFRPEATEDPLDARHWFTLELRQPISQGLRGRIVHTRGGRFDSGNPVQHQLVGEVDLLPVRCGRMDLEYRFDDHSRAGAFRGLQGRIELHRLGQCAEPEGTAE